MTETAGRVVQSESEVLVLCIDPVLKALWLAYRDQRPFYLPEAALTVALTQALFHEASVLLQRQRMGEASEADSKRLESARHGLAAVGYQVRWPAGSPRAEASSDGEQWFPI